MKGKVKTNLGGTSIDKFILMTTTYAKSLEKAVFNEMKPPVSEVSEKIGRLKLLQEEVKEGSHKAVILRNFLRNEINSDMSRMCEWVNIHANGAQDILNQCAFEPCKARSTSPLPSGIKKLIVYKSDQSGKAQIVWRGNGSKFYRAQMTVDPTQQEFWKDVATVTSNRCELDDLPVGTFCFFRVQGVNATGAGAFSEVYIYMAS